ncbi:MAG: purine/pyrimidine permease [Deltaproteobacteria bacterium]|nr:purine/pyrimidine permease [Deltaproteobacteria bacterium]
MTTTGIRYEPHESPPAAVSLGLGLQLAVISATVTILIPTVVMRAANAAEVHLAWAVFAATLICGAATVLQTARLGRFGMGQVLMMGSSGAFIAVCITAAAEGGPGLLATLVVVAALFQLVLSARLSLFRRIMTPTVSGTVIMLIPVTVMPVVFKMLSDVPEGSPAAAAPVTAVVTVLVILGASLKASGALRLWAPVVGVACGAVVAAPFGIYDMGPVAAASWVGLPNGQWPGLAFDFGPAFWALLPAFLLVALIGSIRTISSSIAAQRTSWRRPRAVDFRAVQGAAAVDGIGNLVSGLAGTVPNTAYTTAVSVAELTGVAARSLGVAAGVILMALAFLPKALALVVAIPAPVVAAYLIVIVAMLFVIGMKMVLQDGMDYRKGLVVGVAFWIGVGFQNGVVFPEYVAGFAGGLFRNGMTAGGLAAILMSAFMDLTEPRRRRFECELGIAALPKIREFLDNFASASGWTAAMGDRLAAAAEEALLTLMRQDEAGGEVRRLRLVAYRQDVGAVLEFAVAPGGENLQDRMALLAEHAGDGPNESEMSLRLLRHVAAWVRHQQYHDTDILTVRVEAPPPMRDG